MPLFKVHWSGIINGDFYVEAEKGSEAVDIVAEIDKKKFEGDSQAGLFYAISVEGIPNFYPKPK